MRAHSITYNRDSHDYDLHIENDDYEWQYIGSYRSYIQAENAKDAIAYNQLADKSVVETALTPAQRIARLAVEANKALALGDRETYAELKRQALELKAAELGIEYSVFAAELATYQASKKQAA